VLAHFFAESAVLTALSVVCALAATAFGIRLLVHSGSAQIPRLTEVRVDGAVAAFAVIVAAIVAVACSAIPALRFMRADPLAGLRDGGRSGTIGAHRQRARGALVIAQMAFALVILAGSGLLLRSVQRLRSVHPGFNAEGVGSLWLALTSQRYVGDSTVMQFGQRVRDAAERIPGVISVGITSRVPLEDHAMNQSPLYVEGDVAGANAMPMLETYTTADRGYFSTMSIPLITGRMFDALERQHGDEALISREVSRALFHDSTGRTAVGKRFRIVPNGMWHTVIGVVGGVRDTALAAPPTRLVYLPPTVGGDTIGGQLSRTMGIVFRTANDGDVPAATRALQRMLRDLDPALPTFDARSMRATMDASIARVTFMMAVLSAAAAMTLALTIVGLYGVIAYVVTLRTRELGVRVALGAQPSSVAMMMTKQSLRLSGAGIVLGLLMVFGLARYLRSFLFEIAPTDAFTLVGATLTMLAFALLATWLPARRAARTNPMEALRVD
jgi:predicted permease